MLLSLCFFFIYPLFLLTFFSFFLPVVLVSVYLLIYLFIYLSFRVSLFLSTFYSLFLTFTIFFVYFTLSIFRSFCTFVCVSRLLSFYLLCFLPNVVWDCQVFVHEIRWRIDTRDLTKYPCRAAFTLQLSVYLRSVCSERTKVTMWVTVALPCRTCYQNWIYNLRVLTSRYSPPRLSVWLPENINIHYWLLYLLLCCVV
jgi:hypothetical protein